MIRLGQRAAARDEAIDLVGQMLVGGGYVQPAYVDSMKARELTMSTYVGNGVAIPHGTFEDKTLILATGVAAVRDERIGVLANLARVLEGETVSKSLWTTASPDYVLETLGRPWQDPP